MVKVVLKDGREFVGAEVSIAENLVSVGSNRDIGLGITEYTLIQIPKDLIERIEF
jgi:hypothetical protein